MGQPTIKGWDEAKERRERIAARHIVVADTCSRLADTDVMPNIYAHEAAVLSEIADILKEATEAGEIRLVTCLDLYEALLDAQEACLNERLAQLEKLKQ